MVAVSPLVRYIFEKSYLGSIISLCLLITEASGELRGHWKRSVITSRFETKTDGMATINFRSAKCLMASAEDTPSDVVSLGVQYHYISMT